MTELFLRNAAFPLFVMQPHDDKNRQQEYTRLKFALSDHLLPQEWARLAKVLNVPAGIVAGFSAAYDLFTWMEGKLEDDKVTPLLSVDCLDKLKEHLHEINKSQLIENIRAFEFGTFI